MDNFLIYLVPLIGVVALIFTFFRTSWINKQEVGNEKMKKISAFISDGAMAFIKAEYKILAIFIVLITLVLIFVADPETSSPLVAFSFILGASSSALAGFIGMRIATKANVRTANAARTSLNAALKVAFTGGSVMGLSVVGLGMLGLGFLFNLYTNIFGFDPP